MLKWVASRQMRPSRQYNVRAVTLHRASTRNSNGQGWRRGGPGLLATSDGHRPAAGQAGASAGPLPGHEARRGGRLWHRPHLLGHAPAAQGGHQADSPHGPGRRRGGLYHKRGACGGPHGQHAGTPQHRHHVRLRGRPRICVPRYGIRRRPHARGLPRARGRWHAHKRRMRLPGAIRGERPVLRAREPRAAPGHQAHEHHDRAFGCHKALRLWHGHAGLGRRLWRGARRHRGLHAA